MTKTKIILLIILLVLLIPSYINLSCLSGNGGACAFLPLEFFVTFVWMYLISCLVVEAALATRKLLKKKQKN